MNNAIVGSTYTTVAQFGSRDEIKELADRLQKMMPGGQNYTPAEALTLAQIAVAHDLDPFNGEVWLIKNEESGKVYGALIGLKGHRKHAKKQAEYWGVGANGGFERVMDPPKLKAYGATDTSIVYEYKIMDSVTLEAYTNNLGKLIKAGVPFEQAQKMFGPPPVTLGVGIWSQGDKTKMKPAHCAMFRAEKDALKRRFDVKFTIEIEGRSIPVATNTEPAEELNSEEVEAEYSELVDDVQADERAEEQTPIPAPSATMTLEQAQLVQNREGVNYGNLATDVLANMANELQKSLAKNDLTQEQRDQRAYKLDACRVILASRAK